jgi:hypothetical protein
MRYSSIGLGVLMMASLLCGLGVAARAEEAKTDFPPMSILPAPKTVAIDGDLKEWDLCGKVGPVSFDEEFFDEYHATFYAMYDQVNLYLAATVVEPHLPLNAYPNKGVGSWDADSLTIRLSTIPKDPAAWPLKIDNIATSPELWNGDVWWNHKEKAMFWNGMHGMSGKTYSKKEMAGFDAAVIPAKDGHGYTMELKMPWSVLNATASRPKPGQMIALLFDLNLANGNVAEPKRVFEVYANGYGTNAFRDYIGWGRGIFK